MKRTLVLSLISIFGIRYSEASCTYGYLAENGPSTWATTCGGASGDCDESKQSPIDFPYNGVSIKRDWLPFRLIHYDRHPYKMYIENNGHTAKVTYEAASCTHIPTVIQGGLIDTYELEQFHFHWGSTTTEGSEHTLYGKQFDGELHFVHYNTKCGRNLGEALANCNGHDTAMVLGVFLDKGGSDNHAFDEIIDGLEKVTAESTTKQELKTFDMTKLFPHDLDEFYRYEGGLTTPGCNEVVTFSIFKNPVKLSKRQFAKFYALMTDSGKGSNAAPVPLIDTFRPVQPLNGRTIYYADLKLRCKHRDWTQSRESQCNIYYKETDEELGFMEAVHTCIGYHYSKTPFQGLIPVGRLRCIRNRFKSTSGDDVCGRFFRVNAIKDNRGVWREHPSGQRVEFHHYPEFDPLHGSAGDTLIWDAFLNRLYIDDQHDHYNAMCYRDYENDCERCSGYENGRTCTNSGDCMNSACTCDDQFSTMDCTLGPVPDVEIVEVGGSTTSAMTTSVYTLPSYNQFTGTKGSCNTVPSYSAATTTSTGQVCEYIFGRGICCNGLDGSSAPTDACQFYDCFTEAWKATSSTLKKLKEHAANKVMHKGRDLFWLMAGGQDETSTKSTTMYMMNENMVWADIGVAMPAERINHCQVQINDCEIAFIGGERGTDALDASNDDAMIDIYNYKTKTWRTGPSLAAKVNPATCAIITDQTDYCSYVVIGCGNDPTAVTANSPSPTNVQMWNLETNMVMEMTDTRYACPSGHSTLAENGRFKRLDHSYLAYTNTHDDASGEVWYFTKQFGFKKADVTTDQVSDTTDSHHGGDSFVAPRGTSATASCPQS